MLEISVEEFKTFPNKENYIFFFSIEGLCGLCTQQKIEYEKYGIVPNLIHVKGTITDEQSLEDMNIMALPVSIIFDEFGKEKIKKYGIQYESQIKSLLKRFEENE